MGTYGEFLGVAVLSLVITFVLFKYLKSYATGKDPLLGFTVTYGGALGGFVIVFSILHFAYIKTVGAAINTDVDISGEWTFELSTADGEVHKGHAYIRQNKNDIHFNISGVVTTTSTTFSSYSGVITEYRALFIYENSEREYGIASADLLHDNPNYIIWKFKDVDNFDDDNTPEGTIHFKKHDEETGWLASIINKI